jgi:glycerate 2-kinase
MIDPESFLTDSISKTTISPQLCRILAASVNAVDPFEATLQHITRHENILTVDHRDLDLCAYQRVSIIGFGKASVPMAAAVCEQLDTVFTHGILLTKDGYATTPPGYSFPKDIEVIEAGHPIPDQRGVAGTQKIIGLLECTNANDLVIFLISGGGSALLTSPAGEISLSNLQQTTAALLACGATIQEINCIRKHLDRVKGGQLARISKKATMLCLILSDVVGDPLDIIASGPTVPDPSTFQDAIDILAKFKLTEIMSAPVSSYLRAGVAGQIPETPKSSDPFFKNVQNVLVGNNRKAAEAACLQAKIEGFHSFILTNFLEGEARQVGKTVAAIAKQLALKNEPLTRPACLILGGETTVTVTGNGLGGRNQELALGCVETLAGLERVMVISLATDGGDGPTNAAGAVVSGETYSLAQSFGLDPAKFLAENDAYNFFSILSDLIVTGPTQTNVNDLVFILTY